MKIAVLGLGVVGTAVARVLTERGHDVVRHDPPQGIDGVLADLDMAFICVPTPPVEVTGGRALSASIVEAAIRDIPAGVPTVIRSTLCPGATDRLQVFYDKVPLLFCPEFLDAATAYEDERRPARNIVGYTLKSRQFAPAVHEALADADVTLTMPAAAAELVKLATNGFYATKVAFANQLFDFCDGAGVDYELVRTALESDPRIGSCHLDVYHGGYRGFGGKCLPKDADALLCMTARLGSEASVLAAAIEYNRRLMLAREQATVAWNREQRRELDTESE